MSLGNRLSQESEQEAQINIVPLVDVALVLLIIFMLTATFSKSAALQVRLPETSGRSSSAAQPQNSRLEIQVDSHGALYNSGKPISEERLKTALAECANRDKNRSEVVIQGDQAVSYGYVAHILDLARDAGISKATLEMAPKQQVK
jgi:biopolymer transport protein ExbD